MMLVSFYLWEAIFYDGVHVEESLQLNLWKLNLHCQEMSSDIIVQRSELLDVGSGAETWLKWMLSQGENIARIMVD